MKQILIVEDDSFLNKMLAYRQADGRSQRPLSSVDHGQRKWLI